MHMKKCILVLTMLKCSLFFGFFAPPLGGGIMLVLMSIADSASLGLTFVKNDEIPSLLFFIVIFSYVFGCIPACFVGAIVGASHILIEKLSHFLLLCSILSMFFSFLLNNNSYIFGLVAILPGITVGFLWWKFFRINWPIEKT